MRYRVELVQAEHLPAVRAFNARMRAKNVPSAFLISEHPAAPDPALPVRYRQMVLLEGGEVRGGYLAQLQDFRAGGETVQAMGYQAPISEGIVEKKYAPVGMILIKHALGSTSYVYAVGMGGIEQPLPRLLKGMGWRVELMPFLFHARRPARVLRQVAPLRTTWWRRIGAAIAASSGTGTLALRAAQFPRVRKPRGITTEPFEGFESWADVLWERCRGQHGICAVRNAAVLNQLYPAGGRFRTLRLRSEGEIAAWAVVFETTYRNHKFFGDLRVGTIVDVLAPPEYMAATARCATDALRDLDTDLIITNQRDRRWVDAFRGAGFLPGPSNYVLALSPAFLKEERVHITRGDGDGMVNLAGE